MGVTTPIIKTKIMSNREIYMQEQELSRLEEIVNSKEYLTEEEFDFCMSYDKRVIDEMSNNKL
tara:strand:- start:176 stop:364 length:189 start_codon:yes stop_codon:yes gene_type:complete